MPIDPKLLEDLNERRALVKKAGGEAKLAKRREKGLLSARERLEVFFEPGTFQEFGMHAIHQCKNFGMEKVSLPADGVITGTGYVEGRPVAAYSQDFTVGGGALGWIHAKKICELMEFAHENGMPVVGINDSGGARIQEGVDSLSGYGQVFFKNVFLSGVVPQVAVIAGPCAGGAAYSPALADFLIMTRENANMFICGPGVIQSATGEKASLDQFATAAAHASVSGNIHLVAEDDRQCTLWNETVRLGETFFEELRRHPGPIFEPAIRHIANQSLTIDIYIWLAYRLHVLDRATAISWPSLRDQFGPTYGNLRAFRQRFLQSLD
ncbi:MAG: replication protein RepA, partial [Puniceicoccaceae bacterium]